VKTLNEIVKNQEIISNRINDLLKNGNPEEAIKIVSGIGYQMRTEIPDLDTKKEFDSDEHEIAVFLQDILNKVEKKTDVSDIEMKQIIKLTKKAVNKVTNKVLKTAEVRQNLSDYDRVQYRRELARGLNESQNE